MLGQHWKEERVLDERSIKYFIKYRFGVCLMFDPLDITTQSLIREIALLIDIVIVVQFSFIVEILMILPFLSLGRLQEALRSYQSTWNRQLWEGV